MKLPNRYALFTLNRSLISDLTQLNPLNPKPLGLAAAVGAACAVTAGVAVAQPAVAPDNRGDLALVPYYTVRDDWVTGLHIVNTSERTQVVKVRFRRATDAMDALDFNLVLSPRDVYAGFLSDDENGAIAWTSPDTTCTVPATTPGKRLEMPAIYRAGAETGYVEIIAMGAPAAETSPIALAAKHGAAPSPSTTGASASSTPLDCSAVRSNFFADGKSPTEPGVKDNDETWQRANAASANASLKAGGPTTYTDSGDVLKVSYFIRDNATGIEFGDNAVHVSGFLTGASITNQQYGVFSGDLDGFDFPDMNGGVPLSGAASAPIERARFEALRARNVLGVKRILNEWSANPANGVEMDWVVTLPGQYVMLNLPQYAASLAGAGRPWAPTVSNGAAVSNPRCPRAPIAATAGAAVVECDYRDQPVELSFTAYNREAFQGTPAAGQLVVSSAPPGTVKKTYLPKVANVVSFGGNSVLGRSDANVSASLGQPYGWVRASVKSVDSDVRVCDWDLSEDNGKGSGAVAAGARFPSAAAGRALSVRCSSVTNSGVPVIGFAAWSRRVAANPDASYGRIVEHSYERDRASGAVFRDALKDGGLGPEMVVLPTTSGTAPRLALKRLMRAGSFRMGNLSSTTCSNPSARPRPAHYCDEGPVRRVTISRPIAMGRYEVTHAEYDRFADATGRKRPRGIYGRGRQPVIEVSWNDAKAYAAWLSAQTGKTYRLPTEAEWEYAARAGTTTRYSFGDDITCSQAHYGRRPALPGFGLDVGECSSSYDGTATVGSFAANSFGLYDMHGNVLEWVEDCYEYDYSRAPTDGSAWTGTGCSFSTRVLRGGSWFDNKLNLRSANRAGGQPSTAGSFDGFRLVQDLNP